MRNPIHPSLRYLKRPLRPRGHRRGFSLVVTMIMMVMIAILAMCTLTLSTTVIRHTGREGPQKMAEANARLSLMMALGRLQEEVGDDRRITADASILESRGQGHLVGVWESWSPRFALNPGQSPPAYDREKESRFRSWLVSGIHAGEKEWGLEPSSGPSVLLFKREKDGFDLSGSTVDLPDGKYAWVVSQENTKAKLNVAGREDAEIALEENSVLQVQPRPSFSFAKMLRQPGANHNIRADALLSMRQVPLDEEIVNGSEDLSALGASYTVHSYGVLSNAVDGGLKKDLSLAADMSDADFAKDSWDGRSNPFRVSGRGKAVTSPSSYKGERPLFSPIVEDPIVSYQIAYDPTNLANRLYAAGVPTFDHLRSFCRIPYHLYGTEPTVPSRADDHVAIKLPVTPPEKHYFGPAKPPQGRKSQLSISPVLNRAMFLLSAGLGDDDQVRLIITPVIALWNPYNVNLDFEGGVVYPWMDIPFRTEWKFTDNKGASKTYQLFMSNMMGKQQGRSIDPYFFCELTAAGDGALGKPITLKAGEIRVFSPASQKPIDYRRMANNQNRTIRMKPVATVQELTTRGGLSMTMRGGINNEGFSHVMKPGDTVTSKFLESGATGRFNYFVSFEDATRIRDKSDQASGQVLSEVQTIKFASPVTSVTSRNMTYEELKDDRQPFGVLETFQHVANKGLTTAKSVSAILYTTNPRHAAICHLLAPGSFTEVPHFQSSLRPVSSFDGAIQTTFDGQRAFWGAAQEPPLGREELPFFEIPQEPVLSLGSLQHVNMGASTFSSPMPFANSWPSPYLSLTQVSRVDKDRVAAGIPVYDTGYLGNEALWDGFFFSGISPHLQPGSSPGGGSGWDQPNAKFTKSTRQVIEDFIKSPRLHPLGNERMTLHRGGKAADQLAELLSKPEGCLAAAAHLMVDGAFNVNSTDPEAWMAVLSGLRGRKFVTNKGTVSMSDATPFPRFRHPMGVNNDNWNGFRSLTDEEIRKMADLIVEDVKKRGPFLSMAEFVNRRVEDSQFGKSGLIQASIDKLGINGSTSQQPFPVVPYPKEAQPHIIADTGVGILGFLTQADVLQSLAPIITCRSDSFVVRAYGDARDKNGKVISRACCEAVVQRTPNFVDGKDSPEKDLDDVNETNKRFGRKFEVVSFRWLNHSEMKQVELSAR